MWWNVGHRAYDISSNLCDDDFATFGKLRHPPKNGGQSRPIRIVRTELSKRSECEPIDLLGISLAEVSKDH